MPQTLKELATLYWRVTDKVFIILFPLVIALNTANIIIKPSWLTLLSFVSLLIIGVAFIKLDYLRGLIKHGVLEENHATARAIIEQDMNS